MKAVVLGGGVAGLVAALRLAQGGADVVLAEASGRTGGKVRTVRAGGFTVEVGPDVFLTRKGAVAALCRELGLGDALTPVSTRTHVLRDGRLYPLPDGLTGLVPGKLLPLVRTPLLSWRDKLRACCEPFVRRRAADTDEGLEAFIVRRFGRGVYHRLAGPLVSGLFGTDAGATSLRATLPHLHAMERAHGSIVRALARKPAGVAPAGPAFLTLRGGMDRLTDALADACRRAGVAIRTDFRAVAIGASGAGYTVSFAEGPALEATALVVALPARAAAALVGDLDEALAAPLGAIPHGSVGVVVLGFEGVDEKVLPDTTGYLIPADARDRVQAVTVFSRKHPHSVEDAGQAGRLLVRLFIAPDSDGTLPPDDAMVEAARVEVAATLNLDAVPAWTHVHRWEQAMPRYTLGHLGRLAALDAALAVHPRLALTGTSLRGAGLPDVVADAERVAAALLDGAPVSLSAR